MKPEPILKFRIYPEKRTLFLRIFVWKTLKDFRSANPGNSTAYGLCSSYRRLKVFPKAAKRPDRLLPVIGDIHLARRYLTARIISHELTHALFSWMAEMKIQPDYSTAMKRTTGGALDIDSPEERACYAMGEMYRQTVVELTKRKLI